MRVYSQHCRRSGFGITETLIAVLVVAMGLASASPLIIQASYAVRRGRDHYVATTIALATLERARNLDIGLLPLLVESNRRVDQQGNTRADGIFRRSVTVLPDNPQTGLTTVTVTVEILNRRHGDFRGEQQQISMAYTVY